MRFSSFRDFYWKSFNCFPNESTSIIAGFSEEPETNGEEHHEEHETEVEENSNGSEVDTEDHLEEHVTEEQEQGPDGNFHENYGKTS